MENKKAIDALGEHTINILEETGALFTLLWDVIRAAFRFKVNVKNTYDQMVRIGIESIPVALVTAFFVGMVFAIQIATEFAKFGAGKMVGGVMAIAVARELAPVLTAVVLAGRVGASIAAELGTMKVTQQIDAMYALGTTPVRYLIIPRFIASTVMFPVLTVFATLVGFVGSYLVSVYLIHISPAGYMETTEQFMKISDLMGGIFKSVVFGGAIAIIACYKGLMAKNGAKGVGEVTTSAVVLSLITIFIANYFLSVALFK
jgi:phospholipid/cholesterol/gamma-HCH transport system permease protein